MANVNFGNEDRVPHPVTRTALSTLANRADSSNPLLRDMGNKNRPVERTPTTKKHATKSLHQRVVGTPHVFLRCMYRHVRTERRNLVHRLHTRTLTSETLFTVLMNEPLLHPLHEGPPHHIISGCTSYDCTNMSSWTL